MMSGSKAPDFDAYGLQKLIDIAVKAPERLYTYENGTLTLPSISNCKIIYTLNIIFYLGGDVQHEKREL